MHPYTQTGVHATRAPICRPIADDRVQRDGFVQCRCTSSLAHIRQLGSWNARAMPCAMMCRPKRRSALVCFLQPHTKMAPHSSTTIHSTVAIHCAFYIRATAQAHIGRVSAIISWGFAKMKRSHLTPIASVSDLQNIGHIGRAHLTCSTNWHSVRADAHPTNAPSPPTLV